MKLDFVCDDRFEHETIRLIGYFLMIDYFQWNDYCQLIEYFQSIEYFLLIEYFQLEIPDGEYWQLQQKPRNRVTAEARLRPTDGRRE